MRVWWLSTGWVDFALPGVHVQPEGNVTLVNLPTYFEVRWPAQGVQPREIATVQLLGRREVSESVTIDGPTQGVQVRQARARLEAG